MMELPVSDEVVRRFLLGELDAPERRPIEESFISDPDLRDRLLVAEDELIEDYLENSLSPSERARFISHFLAAPQQQRKLRVAKSLREYVTSENTIRSGQGSDKAAGPLRCWWGFFSALQQWPRPLLVPLIVVLALVVVFGGRWLIALRRLNPKTPPANSRGSPIEQELAKLNSRSSLEHPQPANEVLSIALPPVSVRSLKPAEVTLTTRAVVVELLLEWTEKEAYSSYRAVLQRVGDDDQFTISNLQIEDRREGKVIRLRIPLHILTRGTYQVELSGDPDAAKPATPAEYTFVVTG